MRRIVISVLLGLLALLLFGRVELKISGGFNVLPGHNSDVRARVEGIIEQVYVNEGDWIQKGKLLARLSAGTTIA